MYDGFSIKRKFGFVSSLFSSLNLSDGPKFQFGIYLDQSTILTNHIDYRFRTTRKLDSFFNGGPMKLVEAGAGRSETLRDKRGVITRRALYR